MPDREGEQGRASASISVSFLACLPAAAALLIVSSSTSAMASAVETVSASFSTKGVKNVRVRPVQPPTAGPSWQILFSENVQNVQRLTEGSAPCFWASFSTALKTFIQDELPERNCRGPFEDHPSESGGSQTRFRDTRCNSRVPRSQQGKGGWKTGKGCVSLRVGAMIKASSDDIYRERKERLRQHGEVAAMVKQHGSTFRGDVFL